MANIKEIISSVEEINPELANQLKKYVKDHSYGLVFEQNLPENVRLYTKTAAVGDTVNIRPASGKEETEENKVPWVVKSIEDSIAVIENGEKLQKVAVEDLVPTVSYKDVIYPGLKEVDRIERGSKDDPYQVVINAENYHALEMLTYCYAGKVDCIYIDPPYNTGAKDWKYNNDYVDETDQYRHSKWLAFMERRLKLAKQLLNPEDSVLIVTIDEKEYLHLGMLLEQLFPNARLQMISSVTNPAGAGRTYDFARTDEYIFIAQFGSSFVSPESRNLENVPIVWDTLRRSNAKNIRSTLPNQFYPIYVNNKSGYIEKIGSPLPTEMKTEDAPKLEGCTSVFPIRDNGVEMVWGCRPEELRKRFKSGYVKAGKATPNKPQKYVISYVTSGVIEDIENGKAIISGRNKDGSVIAYYPKGRDKMPTTNWNRPTHDAQRYGTEILKSIFRDNRFTFPKSLYAVRDVLKFFIGSKSEALVVDFFAGSGTTLQAVNLLNAEDDGHRCCICVTNNEVSANEQKTFINQGLRPGDDDWESHGIARYVTWPRTKCTIEGININGEPLTGNYIGVDGSKDSDLQMSDGFKANAVFFDLTYESAWPIRLDNAFDAIAPILWMQAGCKGPIIKKRGKSYSLTDYYGVLFDYNQASKFCADIKNKPTVKTAYVVTDDQRRYSNICKRLPGIEVHRLYETYLRTFEICGEGGLD